MPYGLAKLYLVSILIAPACCLAAEAGIAYGPEPAQKLDICRPSSRSTAAPALLMIHGGGWRTGSRTAQAGVCHLIAQTGVVAIPVGYQLVTTQPETKWPVQFNDVQLAMRWVRSHASELEVDPDRICAEGDSAGGQLALLLDVVPTIGPGNDQQALSGVSPRADCAISISGPTDLLSIEAAHPGYANFLVGQGSPAFVRAQKLTGSPAMRMYPGAGPALLIHGKDDPFVPFSQAQEMRQVYARGGTSAWLVLHPGGHEFQGLTGKQGREAWALIGSFVRSRGLAVPPREISADEILR